MQPLAVEVPGLFVQCTVARGRFEVRSGEDGKGDTLTDVTLHCSGAYHDRTEWQHVEHAPSRARSAAHAADVPAVYDYYDAVGLQYGPGYRTLVQAWCGSDALARLRARATYEGTGVHPADLDDAQCLSLLIAAEGGDESETRLPFAVGVAQLEGGHRKLWAVR